MRNKRFLSLILAIILISSLFAGITGTASADDSSIIVHTVKSGDYMLKICKQYGLTYNVCKNAIMLLNGFTSETQMNRIYPGQKIKLPASDALALTVKQEITINGGGSSGSSGSSGGTTPTTTDSILYYLVQHTVASGETLISICKSVGSDYTKYANTILTINGLTSVTRIYAGKVLYIPVDTKPTSGTYYAAVSHKVNSGETITSICSSYGVNYSTNTALVQGLNDGVNLNAIKVGQTVVVPSTKTTSSSGTTPSTTGEYAISIMTQSGSADAGSPYATVNGNSVTKAASGVTVTIHGGSNTNSVLSIVKVQRADTKATISFDNGTDSFVMPSCAVIVTVAYYDGYAINKTVDGGHGSFETYVNDAIVSFAGQGRKVTVKTSPNSGYVLDSVTVKTKSGSVITPTKSTTNSYYFTMPSEDVTVTVKYAQAVYYKISLVYNNDTKSSSYGSATCKVDGVVVGSNGVAKGTVVTVEGAPKTGYGVSAVYFTNASGTYVKATAVSENVWTFEMPACATTVKVEFARNDKYNINTNLASNYGSVKYRIKNGVGSYSDYTVTAKPGQTVAYMVNNEKWWAVSVSSITYANGSAVIPVPTTVNSDGYYEFTMPAASVTVTTTASQDNKNRFSIWHDPAGNVAFQSYRQNGTALIATEMFAQGETVVLKPVSTKSGSTVKFYYYTGSKYNEIGTNTASITMPGGNVAIKAVLASVGSTQVSCLVNGEAGILKALLNGAEIASSDISSTSTVYTGKTLTFSVIEGTDSTGATCSLSKLTACVINKQTIDVISETDITSSYTSGYTIPDIAAGNELWFEATFKAGNQFEVKTSKDGEFDDKCIVTANKTVGRTGEEVAVSVSAASSTNYRLARVTVNGTEIAMTQTSNKEYSGTFKMPAADASVVAYFERDLFTVNVPQSATGVERVFLMDASNSYSEAVSAGRRADTPVEVERSGNVMMYIQTNCTATKDDITVIVNNKKLDVFDANDAQAIAAGYKFYVIIDNVVSNLTPTIQPVTVSVSATPAVATASAPEETVSEETTSTEESTAPAVIFPE